MFLNKCTSKSDPLYLFHIFILDYIYHPELLSPLSDHGYSSYRSVKSPLGLVLYCYFYMPTINKTDLILSYIGQLFLCLDLIFMTQCFLLNLLQISRICIFNNHSIFNIYFYFQTPVVVDPDGMASFDLIRANEHIHESEVSLFISYYPLVNEVAKGYSNATVRPSSVCPSVTSL